MKQKTNINDSWVLSRAGYFSPSFSNFTSQFALKLPEEKRKKVDEKLEKVAQILGPQGTTKLDKLNELEKLDTPTWVKPFVSKIMEQVSQQVSSGLSKVAENLFGAGIFSLSEALLDVTKERGITHEGVLRLIGMLPEFEALMYFFNVRKYYRDHCAHQLRVAVLGDFLLDLKSEVGGIEGVIKDKLDLPSEEVRTAWWFAGLLHDTGIPLAKLCAATNWSLLNEILRCYSSLDIEFSPMFISIASDNLQNREYLSILVDGMPKRWQEITKKGLGVPKHTNETILFKSGYYPGREYQPRSVHIDHGVVGAINLLRTLETPEKLKKNLPEDKPLIEAAKAICLHNFKDDLRNVPFEDFPLAFLLILADELQEWSRPVPVPIKDTYFTTSLQKVTLLDVISYDRSDELWDIPHENMQAKKLAKFDFRRLCKDKEFTLRILDCTENFPESEVQLRDVNAEKPKKEKRFDIKIKTR